MKYMTAKEEDILSNQTYIQNGTVIDKLLKSLVVTKVDFDDILKVKTKRDTAKAKKKKEKEDMEKAKKKLAAEVKKKIKTLKKVKLPNFSVGTLE